MDDSSTPAPPSTPGKFHATTASSSSSSRGSILPAPNRNPAAAAEGAYPASPNPQDPLPGPITAAAAADDTMAANKQQPHTAIGTTVTLPKPHRLPSLSATAFTRITYHVSLVFLALFALGALLLLVRIVHRLLVLTGWFRDHRAALLLRSRSRSPPLVGGGRRGGGEVEEAAGREDWWWRRRRWFGRWARHSPVLGEGLLAEKRGRSLRRPSV